MLAEIEERREEGARHYARTLDGWQGKVLLSEEEIAAASQNVGEQLRSDIEFAYRRVCDFALRQKESVQEFECELSPGLTAGQKLIPVNCAGCYVPGGRYAHIASALMSVATARVAGVGNVVACSPPRDERGAHPAIIYALQLAGATHILQLGGVQGIAALAYGLFTGREADILVGPGNRFVAEAKRQLFGRCGIDMVAGPTEIAIIADEHAHADIVACDLVSQAEHGLDSPAWLFSTCEKLAREVLQEVERQIEDLPGPAAEVARQSWRDYGEIAVGSAEEMACLSDEYAAEHLELHVQDIAWWRNRLRCYGSLFLGEESTVAFGDKCSGPNHILPTRRAARYTGGLSVHKFIKIVSYQQQTREATRDIAKVAARLSRHEGMEAHARSGDIRLRKYYPEELAEAVPIEQ